MGVSENVKGRVKTPKLGKWTSRFPLLVERAKEWGFEIPSEAPFADRIIVWRLPPIQKSGMLWVPEDAQDPHVIGVLVAAGMQALDTFQSNGITLGHYVTFERFAGWERDDQTPEHKRGSRFLHLNSRNILASIDLKDDLESGRINYQLGEDSRHRLEIRELPPSDRRAKVLRLAEDPSATPAEKRTARRIAAKLKKQGDPHGA